MSKAAAKRDRPKYTEDEEVMKEFLLSGGGGKYMEQLKAIQNRESKTLCLSIDDVDSFKTTHVAATGLGDRIQRLPTSYIHVISDAIDSLLASVVPRTQEGTIKEDIKDYLYNQTMREIRKTEDDADAQRAKLATMIPAEYLRRYEVIIVPRKEAKIIPIRQLRSHCVGRLSTVSGLCISSSPVHPKASVVVYTCDQCNQARYQPVTGDVFTPIVNCDMQECKTKFTRGRLMPQMKANKFLSYQEVRLQELQSEVPNGSTPRVLRVLCEESCAGIATPGAVLDVTGVFMPDTGGGNRRGAAFKQSVMTPMLFRASAVKLQKKTYNESTDRPMDERLSEVTFAMKDTELMAKLVRSIAPEIFGLDDVKKVLLCQLIGGVELDRPDGLRLRGDVNVCLMGDPGVAKSQLLRWVSVLCPRSVFTTGKGSSGVGLTVSVSIDEHTRETVLEPGALVLSDKGICAIDEFDKMDEHDRTAIHEVMEQQTVSVAKGGIVTSLNARASILAAANPQFGRWRRNRTCASNINLPPSLLSRFDVLWLLLDQGTSDTDMLLADHILRVHQHGASAAGMTQREQMFGHNARCPYFGKDFVHAWIAEAKRLKPFLEDAAMGLLQENYCEMRRDEALQGEDATTYTTPRNLMSMLRMSQALARLRLGTSVTIDDVREAVRLMRASKESIISTQRTAGLGRARDSPVTRVYLFLKSETLREGSQASAPVPLANYLQHLRRQGLTRDHIEECLKKYSENGIWEVKYDAAGSPSSLTWN